MADSNFWKDMAAQLRALDPSACVWLRWRKFRDEGNYNFWIEAADRPNCNQVKAQFVSLATRCGASMANANTSSALRLWIDPIIKMSKPGEHQAGRSLRDNGTTEDWIGGVIEHIAAVSAGLCMAFEAAEVEKERLAASPKEPLSDDPLEAINAPDIGFELGTETQDKIRAEFRIVIGKKRRVHIL
jgi:hypothetical protein